MAPQITQRPLSESICQTLVADGIDPLLARLCAARGIVSAIELDHRLNALLPFTMLKNAEALAVRLADIIAERRKILVVADYDADGATACVVAVRGLTRLGAQVDFVVPNRFEYGYGLTPQIVDLAAQYQPDVLLTVDNGIASVAGVERARELGMEVLITDHHLPGETLPDALIVNPNQPGCEFPSKSLSGVGVIFYVLMALRAELRRRGAFAERVEPNLAELLDLVALGTVADVVRLDQNNRILVDQGLRRIRAGRMQPGVAALFAVAGRDPFKASTFDLGFALGPRLNAAGRMDDMSIGIACLLADSEEQATPLARELDQLNRERRNVETDMQVEALNSLKLTDVSLQYTLSLYQEDWHQGVVGILASRLKDRFHRPCLVFAQADNGELRGSGRSIQGFHLRDALDLVSKRHPGLISRFGGHAMAAGLSIPPTAFEGFSQAFEQVARELLASSMLTRHIDTDGSLSGRDISLETAQQLDGIVWGQGFPPPSFHDCFQVVSQRLVGEKHLKLQISKDGVAFGAMLFNHSDWLPDTIEAVYRLIANEWRGKHELQLYIDYWNGVDG